MIAHVVFFSLSMLAAFALAYNFHRALRWPPAYVGGPIGVGWLYTLLPPMLLLSVLIKTLVFGVTGQYRGSWRYIGFHDLFGVSWAALISSVILVIAYFLVENLSTQMTGQALIDRFTPPRFRQSIFLLDFGMTIAFVCGARIVVRFYYEEVRVHRAASARRLLIVGSGDEAESVIRQIRRMPEVGYVVVGLVDDRASGQSGTIHGAAFLGSTDRLPELVARHSVDEVLIALPNARPREMREWVERCSGTGVRFRVLPSVSALMEDRVQVNYIRDVDIADLLRRDPVQLDTERIAQQIRGRTIVVTGAGGSIGSELTRQIAQFGPSRLVLMERAENALFEIDRELRRGFPALDIVAAIADVCDGRRVADVFATHRPDLVFHAAAHKHVPMMEINVGEAIKNNVGGTLSVARAAADAGVPRMVLISTDKAINPTSIMGCTKRVAELVVQATNQRRDIQIVTVRFGNVLGSDGSVVPIFQRQIAAGGPVTVTHPEMRRYFMTIPEASQLVLQAGTMGQGGEIYLLDMGEPIKIVDLARDMITLSGLRPGVDVDITFTGIRPGEKLFEELTIDGEEVAGTQHPSIGVHKHREADADVVLKSVHELLDANDAADDERRRALLRHIVPEYQRNIS